MRKSILAKWLVLALLTACAPSERDEASTQTAAIRTPEQAQAALIRAARFRESLAPVMRAVMHDPGQIGNDVRAALSDADRVIFNTSLPREAPVNAVRKAVASLGKNAMSRRTMVQSSLEAVERRSTQLKALIRESLNFQGAVPNRSNWFDEVVVGTGPQGVAYLQAATDLAPFKRVLAIDIAKKPGGTFANVNEAFALNSTNRANTGRRARPGEGDLNFIQDVWGLPDFEAQKWVPAGGLGDLSIVGTDLSLADVLLETRLVRARDKFLEGDSALWPARYLLELEDVVTGAPMKVFANKVVVASGIGKPTVPFTEPGTLALVAEEAARVSLLDPNDMAGIISYTDLVNRIGQVDRPYRPFVGKTTAVVGGGDSGKVVNEFLYRLAPDGAYGQDVAQVGNVGRVFWFGVSFEDCLKYIAESRGRYSRLQSALNSGDLVPVPGRVETIVRDGDAFRITYRDPAGNVQTQQFAARAGNSRNGSNQAVDSTFDNRVDKIVLATGFKSEAEQVFQPILRAEEGSLGRQLDDVVGRPEGFDGEVAIASRLRSSAEGVAPQEVYFVGPSNEVRGGLPKVDELARVNANTVSLFANVARTVETARLNAQTPAIGLGPIFELLDTPKLAELARNRLPGSRAAVPVARVNGAQPLMRLSGIPDIDLKVQIAKLMGRFEMPAGEKITVTVERLAEGQLGVRVPELDAQSEAALAYSFIRPDTKLGEMLFAYFGNSRMLKRLEIVVPTYENSSQVREVAIEVLQRFN